LVHHPLSEEYGSPVEELQRCAEIERRLLPLFRGVLAPSRRTADAVAALGVSGTRIAITPPGTARPDRLPPPRSGPIRRLLYVANVIPRKGHEVLVAALARLHALDWELECIGALDRDLGHAHRVQQQIEAAGLRDRVRLTGAKPPAEVAHAYRAADAFVSASLHEGYGMAWAEAMAWGLPQVTTTAGAVAEVVPPEAGLLVPPNDAGALSAALQRLLDDPALATRLAAGARAAAARLPDWPAAVVRWETAFDRLTRLSPGSPPDR
jgi:glycosyltransferase involved in cell wall biosynthesis